MKDCSERQVVMMLPMVVCEERVGGLAGGEKSAPVRARRGSEVFEGCEALSQGIADGRSMVAVVYEGRVLLEVLGDWCMLDDNRVGRSEQGGIEAIVAESQRVVNGVVRVAIGGPVSGGMRLCDASECAQERRRRSGNRPPSRWLCVRARPGSQSQVASVDCASSQGYCVDGHLSTKAKRFEVGSYDSS